VPGRSAHGFWDGHQGITVRKVLVGAVPRSSGVLPRCHHRPSQPPDRADGFGGGGVEIEEVGAPEPGRSTVSRPTQSWAAGLPGAQLGLPSACESSSIRSSPSPGLVRTMRATTGSGRSEPLAIVAETGRRKAAPASVCLTRRSRSMTPAGRHRSKGSALRDLDEEDRRTPGRSSATHPWTARSAAWSTAPAWR